MFKNIPGKMSVLEAPGATRKAVTMGRVGPLNILLSANGMIIRSRMSQYVVCGLCFDCFGAFFALRGNVEFSF